jgi:Mrp family chromosome partitioning ATPase
MNDPLESENQDLREYLRPIWAHKILILVLVLVGTAGTYKYYDGKPRTYTTSTTVFVGDPGGADTGFAPNSERALQNQARLLRTRSVATRVAKKIGYRGDPGVLLAYVNATAAKDTDFLVVSSTGGDPRLVAALANAFAQAFIDMRSSARRQALQQELAALQKQFDGAAPGDIAYKRSIRGRINQLELSAATPSGEARQLDPALPPGAPSSPDPKRNAVFALALSLLLGIIAAFGLERINRRIRSTEEAGRAFRMPVIATIEHEPEIAADVAGRASIADSVRESFRSLRSNLELASSQRPLRTILVTSAVQAEGKSTVAGNLALVYAEAGQRVAVIDADLRRPSLARLFRTEGSPGLADVLMGLQPLEAVVQTISAHAPAPVMARERDGGDAQVGEGGVAVLPFTNGHGDREEAIARLNFIASGPRPADPPAMFSAPSMAALIDRVASEHDIVIIDTPPLLAVSDAMPLLAMVDGALLVCRLGVSTIDGADRVLTMSARVPQARMLGLVVNDIEGGSGDRYGAY